MSTHIYLDHGASTPVNPQIIEKMVPFWTDHYGNPSSSHAHGRSAGFALDEARLTIAQLMNAQAKEIVFTGCGSESDNLAVRGVMWAARKNGTGNHLITSATEHEAVIETAVQLRDQFNFDVTILGVDAYGRVSVDNVAAAIRPDTALISIMAANNEIGTMQPIQEIGALARQHDILFHTDAVQAAATTRWDMQTMPIDLISFAPHKFYGPKGVGMLYVRDGVELVSALTGGGQEDGRRSGTVNVAFAVGAAEAFKLAQDNLEAHVAHYTTLRDQLIAGVMAAVPTDEIVLTGHPTERLPHHASFALKNLSGNDLLMHLDMVGISASSGSACKTGNPKPSAILETIGLGPAWTTGGLRFTVGSQNTPAHIERVIQAMPTIIEKVRKVSQLFFPAN
ncbi:MAG: cysteine desulfurase [Ardenticatenaceae bacterium]|nr:cysteine desulfurase [Anaerolineales bacterium]MCB8940933.1 cysteine desulfurase [Ardenticatenaceae bacterium]MCB8972272.1 cysteine desulfurase [Ardenticatenaceae bacterium]